VIPNAEMIDRLAALQTPAEAKELWREYVADLHAEAGRIEGLDLEDVAWRNVDYLLGRCDLATAVRIHTLLARVHNRPGGQPPNTEGISSFGGAPPSGEAGYPPRAA